MLSYFSHKARYWQRRGVKGPKALPIIGNLWDNVKMTVNELEEQRFLKYGRLYGTMQGLKPVLTVGEPDLIKQIMITDFRVFMNHTSVLPNDPIFMYSVSELWNDEWKRVRAILNPTFTSSKIKAMKPLIEQCIENSFQYLDSISKEGEEIDVKKIATSYTVDVVAECIFGVTTNACKNPNDEFVQKASKLTTWSFWRVLSLMIVPGRLQVKLDIQLMPQELMHHFHKILKGIVTERRNSQVDYVDFVSLLLDAEQKSKENGTKDAKDDGIDNKKSSKTLTDDEIIAQCFAFFLAGFETTSTFLQFTLYALAVNPIEQQKLFTEIRSYFNNQQEFDCDSFQALPYLEAIVCESLRLYSPILYFEHICGRDYKLGDITIEKGVIVNLPFWAMHHDAEFFPNPHQFIPERFLLENRHKIKPYSFMPFGVGPRQCIGYRFSKFQAKLFLAHFVDTYEIMETVKTPKKPEFTTKFITLACKPLFAAIKRRT